MSAELALLLDATGADELADYAPRRPAADTLRRRRASVLLVVALALVALAWGVARTETALGGVPASAPERRPAPATYLVQPGDTMWTIAHQLQPAGDVRPLVRKLVDLNDGAELAVGQLLVLP